MSLTTVLLVPSMCTLPIARARPLILTRNRRYVAAGSAEYRQPYAFAILRSQRGKETGREKMERLRHGNGAARSFLGAFADLNGGIVGGRVSNDVPGPEGVEKRLVGSNDFFEALKIERPVPVKGLVPGEQEDAKTIGDVGRASPKMVDEKGCRLVHGVSSLVLLKRQVALAKLVGRGSVHPDH